MIKCMSFYTVRWTTACNWQKTLSSENTLELKRVKDSDGGCYICHVIPAKGRVFRISASVLVGGKMW